MPSPHGAHFLGVNLRQKLCSQTSLANPQFPLPVLPSLLSLWLLPTVCSIEHSEENTAGLFRGSRGHQGTSCPGGGKQPPPLRPLDWPSQRFLLLHSPMTPESTGPCQWDCSATSGTLWKFPQEPPNTLSLAPSPCPSHAEDTPHQGTVLSLPPSPD